VGGGGYWGEGGTGGLLKIGGRFGLRFRWGLGRVGVGGRVARMHFMGGGFVDGNRIRVGIW